VPRPLLYAIITWDSLQESVLAVFTEALRRLAARSVLPRTEDPINFELYRLAREVHLERQRAKVGDLPFFISRESASQPEPDDTVRSGRLEKIPDFSCLITNPQATDPSLFQLCFYIECKRLGQAVGTWNLNANYSANGIRRFTHLDWQYAKGCAAALMIGYIQNMEPDDVLSEVNAGGAALAFPPLSKRGTAWQPQNVYPLDQVPLTRTFPPPQFPLIHVWVDLRGCTFQDPLPSRPKSVKKKKKKAVKAGPQKSLNKRTAPAKKVTPNKKAKRGGKSAGDAN
jgi:hypothetical protein